MKKRYYVAYGSNLNVDQMRFRCPTAVIAGTAMLRGWELLFRGSMTGSYLTLEEKEGGRVPVAIWDILPGDEKKLDRYEGFPNFYYKKDVRVSMKDLRTGKRRMVNAFVYIMHENRPIGVPDLWYMQTCADGYDVFEFDREYLYKAYRKSKEVCENERRKTHRENLSFVRSSVS